jgi:hypothetical protein
MTKTKTNVGSRKECVATARRESEKLLACLEPSGVMPDGKGRG